jgi:hypothetical protein
MPDYWLDTCSFITPRNSGYSFDIAPGFWEAIDKKSEEGILASSTLVYHELVDEATDDLAEWAKQREKGRLFIEPDDKVQEEFTRVADYVNSYYVPHQAQIFLAHADPWVVAHAKAYGGCVVTFECRIKNNTGNKQVKIPDITDYFDMQCIDLWNLLRKLHISFQLSK